ncbi:TPR-like protein [Hyaloscypha variabilis]
MDSDLDFPRPIWSTTSPAPPPLGAELECSAALQPPEMNARRKIYPEEQWLVLKPLIHHLYIEENQTFIKVAGYLQEHHGFKPTKKQFLRRISEWGFEKNVKKDERRAILESFSEVANEGEFEVRMLRGRRLDKAKIRRWRKREQVGESGCVASSGMEAGNQDDISKGSFCYEEQTQSITMNQGTSSQDGRRFPASLVMEISKNDLSEEIPRYEKQFGWMPMDQGQKLNLWMIVNVTGSPGLTGLIGALTLDCCDFIPELDLSAANPGDWVDAYRCMPPNEDCSRTVSKEVQNQYHYFSAASLSISDLHIYNPSKERQYRMPSPFDELCPFPKSVPRGTSCFRENLKTDHLLSTSSLMKKEFECKKKFKAPRIMEPSAMIDLVNSMRSIAWRHYELDQYPQSEGWWRRVIALSLEIPGYKPSYILRACLQVVNNLHLQGRCKEALRLHHAIHSKIANLVELDHPIAILSKEVLGKIQRSLNNSELESSICREIVQICLCRFGTKSRDTVDALESLGTTLYACHQYQEAAAILDISIQLDCEISHNAKRNTTEVQNTMLAMSYLASCLLGQGKYGDSAAVLVATERYFKDLICLENSSGRLYYKQKAKLLRAEGRLLESEKIFRDILNHGPDNPTVGRNNALYHLASLLTETGLQEEAAALWEKLFFEQVEFKGIAHNTSIADCECLGHFYTKFGRYDDAIHLFQQTIEKLVLIQGNDPDFCNEYIEELSDWILWVEERRREAEKLRK